MSLWNVSMVMSPNLFCCLRPLNKSSGAKQQQQMEEAVGGAYLIRLMVTHQDLLGTVRVLTRTRGRCRPPTCDVTAAPVVQVPTFLLSQVRHMNQASSQKELILSKTKRLLRRKNDKNDLNQVRERERKSPRPLGQSGDPRSPAGCSHLNGTMTLVNLDAASAGLKTKRGRNHGYWSCDRVCVSRSRTSVKV